VLQEGRKIEKNTRGISTATTPNQYTDSYRRGEYSGIAMTEQYTNGNNSSFDNRLTESSTHHDEDPLWDNPFPTRRPYRDDPTHGRHGDTSAAGTSGNATGDNAGIGQTIRQRQAPEIDLLS
jgi:hypothetical protein